MPSGLILVVDDYADAREMLTVALEAEGYVVLTADNGWRALAQARRYLPSAIVMDLFMPEMDGIEATRRLKSDPDTQDVPVVAYTARASSDGLELFDHVCRKPCPPDLLVRLVSDVITARDPSSETLEGARARARALRERALTLCRAFSRMSMKERLGRLVVAIEEHIAHLDAMDDGDSAPGPLLGSLAALQWRIAELERRLVVHGPDAHDGEEREGD